MADEYKYQFSQSDGNGGILVARTNEDSELEAIKNRVNALMGKGNIGVVTVTAPKVETVVATDKTYCAKHQIPMKERSYAGSVWYDHRRKVGEEWESCKGHGYPSETKEAIDKSFGN